MEMLKKIAQAGRLHYEKILLSLVLLGLGGAVLYLFQAKQTEEQNSKNLVSDFGHRKVNGVQPVDLSRHVSVMRMAETPPSLNFSLPHNLFNPVKWQRQPDGSLIKIQTGKEIGPDRMVATRISPLSFIISQDRIASPGAYFLGVVRENAEKAIDRKKKQSFVTLNSKILLSPTQFFVLREVKGPPEEPTELVVELDNGDKVSVSKDKPYARVEGYEADLKYTVDNKAYNNLRLNATVHFAGEDYNIVAINQSEVVLSAKLNDKKYTIRLVGAQ